MLINAQRRQCLWLYFISAHAITSRISSIEPNVKISTLELNVVTVLTAKKKSVHLSNLDIGISGVSRRGLI